MALMRTRRGEDPSKKKGVEPTKTPSNDVQTRKQYTWEDVSRNEDIKAKNRASKAKYESDVQAYSLVKHQVSFTFLRALNLVVIKRYMERTLIQRSGIKLLEVVILTSILNKRD